MASAEYQNWWEMVWSERESLIRRVFGDTHPSGNVIAFTWDNFDAMVPGGCAMVFPPDLPIRPEWLSISHGLAQPSEPSCHIDNNETASGYGYEFGFTTSSNESWCIDALWLLMTYLRQSCNSIERGHRLPIWFLNNPDSSISVKIGRPPSRDICQPHGEMRAAVFWPYMSHPAGFATSEGFFSVLIGTTVTQREWDLAKTTSTAHLLLLLHKAGIGQMSDLSRKSITDDLHFSRLWNPISNLPVEGAEDLLLEAYGVL